MELHRNKRSRTPWRTGLRCLSDLASQLLACMLQDRGVAAMLSGGGFDVKRGWSDAELLVSTPGCTLGRHTDVQPEGALLLIFCAGLSCRSLAWPGGRLVERVLQSGDAMLLDGRRTAHAVPDVLEKTSPFPGCPWLGKRRLAVLVRQEPRM